MVFVPYRPRHNPLGTHTHTHAPYTDTYVPYSMHTLTHTLNTGVRGVRVLGTSHIRLSFGDSGTLFSPTSPLNLYKAAFLCRLIAQHQPFCLYNFKLKQSKDRLVLDSIYIEERSNTLSQGKNCITTYGGKVSIFISIWACFHF